MRLEDAWELGRRITGLDTALLRRIFRYGVTGLTFSILYTLAVVACVLLVPALSPTWASVMAFVVIVPFSYRAHREISFVDRQSGQHQQSSFYITTTSSFLVAVGGMYVITEMLEWNFYFGILWNWMVIPASNFCIYNLWVFSGQRGRP